MHWAVAIFVCIEINHRRQWFPRVRESTRGLEEGVGTAVSLKRSGTHSRCAQFLQNKTLSIYIDNVILNIVLKLKRGTR
jgi:hypothetical protein